MRERYPIPLITPQDFNAFRGLLSPDFANSYDEWFNLHTKEKLERGQVGFDIHEIQVDPNEFVRYCRACGVTPNRKTLLDFAIEKDAGGHY